MASFNPNPLQKPTTSSTDFLLKGILCVAIGAGILIAPYLMAATDLRAMISGSWLVGWFSLGLGCMFTALFLRRRKERT